MRIVQNTVNKPFVKIGILLGFAFAVAQYLFYFGGRGVIMDETFGSTIQLLLIMGLYLGLQYCKNQKKKVTFGRIFLWGVLISFISVSLRIFFSILLYGVFAPELGANYKKMLVEQMTKILANNPTFPISEYEKVLDAMLNTLTIPILENTVLLVSGIIFSLFIASLLTMFRK